MIEREREREGEVGLGSQARRHRQTDRQTEERARLKRGSQRIARDI